MTHAVRRAACVAAICLSFAFAAPRAPARPAALTLDGKRDDGYQLLAQDPAGDLAPGVVVTGTGWADLTDLSVATDTTSLWVYVDLHNYSSNSIGRFGLAIDTDGLASSGAAAGPLADGVGVTFAYTSTYNNVGNSPVVTTSLLLPDVLIRGNLPSLSPDAPSPFGATELNHWTGAAWDDQGSNWGGISGTTTIGTHVALTYGEGLELSIPYADLHIWPTSTVHLEFYALGPKVPGPPTGALDTVPPDAQASASQAATTQRRLATFNLAAPLALPRLSFSASSYAVYEAQGAAPITLTVAPTSTRLISAAFATANGTAGLADYVPLSQVITLAPGLASTVVNLHILTDTLAEPDETVGLALSLPVNAVLGQTYTATLTIHDSPWIGLLDRLFLPLTRR